ncbi:hypothetical protein ACLOJK_016735 [Asimina triloba]
MRRISWPNPPILSTTQFRDPACVKAKETAGNCTLDLYSVPYTKRQVKRTTRMKSDPCRSILERIRLDCGIELADATK